MSKIAKILIAYSNSKKITEMVKTFIQDSNLRVVACLNSGDKVLPLVKHYNPDFLIIDTALSGVNGLDILREVTSFNEVPFVIIYCEEQNDIYWQLSLRYKADLVLQKPVDPKFLLGQIQNVMCLKENKPNKIMCFSFSVSDMEKQITVLLHNLGLPARQKGFHYLRQALQYVALDSDKLFAVTKILYPLVGEKFGVTGRSVEHSISTAIHTIWKNNGKEELTEILGCSLHNNTLPTNVEFISLLLDAIRLRFS